MIADLADRGAHAVASRIQTTYLLALAWRQSDVGSDRTQQRGRNGDQSPLGARAVGVASAKPPDGMEAPGFRGYRVGLLKGLGELDSAPGVVLKANLERLGELHSAFDVILEGNPLPFGGHFILEGSSWQRDIGRVRTRDAFENGCGTLIVAMGPLHRKPKLVMGLSPTQAARHNTPSHHPPPWTGECHSSAKT
jgi:hypothetical protein